MDTSGQRIAVAAEYANYEQSHRYAFASTMAKGKRVLEVGCGQGQGSELLARHAEKLIAVDRSEENINLAIGAYGSRPGLSFQRADAWALPLADASVDLVVAFQTQVHHLELDGLIAECARVLDRHGVLVIASGLEASIDDESADQRSNGANADTDLDALVRAVHRQFGKVQSFGQHSAAASAIYPLGLSAGRTSRVAVDLWSDDGHAVVRRTPHWQSPATLLLIASNGASLPKLDASMLVSELGDPLAATRDFAVELQRRESEHEAERAQALSRAEALADACLNAQHALQEQVRAGQQREASLIEASQAREREFDGERVRAEQGWWRLEAAAEQRLDALRLRLEEEVGRFEALAEARLSQVSALESDVAQARGALQVSERTREQSVAECAERERGWAHSAEVLLAQRTDQLLQEQRHVETGWRRQLAQLRLAQRRRERDWSESASGWQQRMSVQDHHIHSLEAQLAAMSGAIDERERQHAEERTLWLQQASSRADEQASRYEALLARQVAQEAELVAQHRAELERARAQWEAQSERDATAAANQRKELLAQQSAYAVAVAADREAEHERARAQWLAQSELDASRFISQRDELLAQHAADVQALRKGLEREHERERAQWLAQSEMQAASHVSERQVLMAQQAARAEADAARFRAQLDELLAQQAGHAQALLSERQGEHERERALWTARSEADAARFAREREALLEQHTARVQADAVRFLAERDELLAQQAEHAQALLSERAREHERERALWIANAAAEAERHVRERHELVAQHTARSEANTAQWLSQHEEHLAQQAEVSATLAAHRDRDHEAARAQWAAESRRLAADRTLEIDRLVAQWASQTEAAEAVASRQARDQEQLLLQVAALTDRITTLERSHAQQLQALQQAGAAKEEELRQQLVQLQRQLLSSERERASQLLEAEARLRQEHADAAEDRERQNGALAAVAQRAAVLGQALLDLGDAPIWARSAKSRRAWPELAALARETLAGASDAPRDRVTPLGLEPPASPRIDDAVELARPVDPQLDELLKLDDTDFVRAAYQALLGRAADPEGANHYLQALRHGKPRLGVLADLRHSPEGKARPVDLHGLDAMLRQPPHSGDALPGVRVREEVLPIGRVVHRGSDGFSSTVAHIDQRVQQRLTVIEQSVQRGLQGLAEYVQLADQRIDERLRGIENSVQVGVNGLAQELKQTSLDAAERIDGIERWVQLTWSDVECQAQAGAIAQSLHRHQWPPETDVWRLAQQLMEPDEAAFVERLFREVLKRDPFEHEIRFFRDKATRGASRLTLVDKVLSCPEFEHQARAGHPGGAVPAMAEHLPDDAAARAPNWAPALPSIPIHANPKVTVVIPIYGKLDFTLQCLRSIAGHPPAVPFEVIVVDDCSPDDSREVLLRVPGIRLLSNASNQGFIRSCNVGAGAARGSHLYFLNNDTEVKTRWLDELYETFDVFPGTGLVGSKLLCSDRTLQEAGGIVWQDGSAWNFGRGQDPDLPCFNYAREVDYCSGASIMVPKSLFDELGGFDEHYLPAYCEDADLALKIRQAGRRVLYQPLSEVVHHEGATSGTDTAHGVKAYQVVNTKKLHERWQALLSTYQPNAVDVDRAKDRMSTRRVLVIDVCTPTPNQDAGSVTVVNTLCLLRDMRFQVTFVAADNFLYMPDYTPPLQRAGFEVLYAPYVTSIEQHLLESGARYDLVLMWRPSIVEKHLPEVRRLCPRARVVYHTVDLHYLRMEREAELQSDDDKRRAAADMKERELNAIKAVDTAIVHSTHELEVLGSEIDTRNVFVFPLIMNVPGSEAPFAQRAGVGFVGGYQHPPNVDAACWFVAEVMPWLRRRLPGIKFHIIGSKPPQRVLDLASDDVVVEGFVETLQPLLDTLRVSVAPLRYGAGVKGKVGNAMAMGLPVVATRMAVEGMGLVDRESVLIADSAEGLSEAICELHQDEFLWKRLQVNGIECVERRWGGAASYRTLVQLLEGLGFQVEPPAYPLRLYRDERQ